jgi:hypothetical protein
MPPPGPTRGCLRRCDAGSEVCVGGDPLLACQLPGAMGALGFTVNPAETAKFCAPKACVKAEDCAPSGTCTNGYCLRN